MEYPSCRGQSVLYHGHHYNVCSQPPPNWPITQLGPIAKDPLVWDPLQAPRHLCPPPYPHSASQTPLLNNNTNSMTPRAASIPDPPRTTSSASNTLSGCLPPPACPRPNPLQMLNSDFYLSLQSPDSGIAEQFDKTRTNENLRHTHNQDHHDYSLNTFTDPATSGSPTPTPTRQISLDTRPLLNSSVTAAAATSAAVKLKLSSFKETPDPKNPPQDVVFGIVCHNRLAKLPIVINGIEYSEEELERSYKARIAQNAGNYDPLDHLSLGKPKKGRTKQRNASMTNYTGDASPTYASSIDTASVMSSSPPTKQVQSKSGSTRNTKSHTVKPIISDTFTSSPYSSPAFGVTSTDTTTVQNKGPTKRKESRVLDRTNTNTDSEKRKSSNSGVEPSLASLNLRDSESHDNRGRQSPIKAYSPLSIIDNTMRMPRGRSNPGATRVQRQPDLSLTLPRPSSKLRMAENASSSGSSSGPPSSIAPSSSTTPTSTSSCFSWNPNSTDTQNPYGQSGPFSYGDENYLSSWRDRDVQPTESYPSLSLPPSHNDSYNFGMTHPMNQSTTIDFNKPIHYGHPMDQWNPNRGPSYSDVTGTARDASTSGGGPRSNSRGSIHSNEGSSRSVSSHRHPAYLGPTPTSTMTPPPPGLPLYDSENIWGAIPNYSHPSADGPSQPPPRTLGSSNNGARFEQFGRDRFRGVPGNAALNNYNNNIYNSIYRPSSNI